MNSRNDEMYYNMIANKTFAEVIDSMTTEQLKELKNIIEAHEKTTGNYKFFCKKCGAEYSHDNKNIVRKIEQIHKRFGCSFKPEVTSKSSIVFVRRGIIHDEVIEYLNNKLYEEKDDAEGIVHEEPAATVV